MSKDIKSDFIGQGWSNGFLEWLEKKYNVEIENHDIFVIDNGNLKVEQRPAKKFTIKWEDYEEFLKQVK